MLHFALMNLSLEFDFLIKFEGVSYQWKNEQTSPAEK